MISDTHLDGKWGHVTTGVPFTAFQDSFYGELAVEMFDKDGLMKGPAGHGKVSWVGREEVAEAIAALLLSETPRLGALPITGPKAYSMEETAEVLTQVTGKPHRYEEETLDEARAVRASLAPEPWVVDVWVGSYQAIAAGEVAEVTSDLSTILGRAASDLKTYLAARSQK